MLRSAAFINSLLEKRVTERDQEFEFNKERQEKSKILIDCHTKSYIPA